MFYGCQNIKRVILALEETKIKSLLNPEQIICV